MNSSKRTNLLPSPLGKKMWPWVTEASQLPRTMPDGVPCPKVTIVTPSYNQGEFIEETIRSVLLQNYPNLEYIIIDGGSTDNTIDIIRKYKSSISYWVSEPDRGQADAINKGFAKTSGEFLGWLNSDDCLYPGAIAKMVTELQNNPEVSMVYGDVDAGYDLEEIQFRLYGEQINLEKMLKTYRVPIPQQGSLWRRTAFEALGGLGQQWNLVLDRDFFLRIAQRFEIAYIPGTVGFFRQHSQSKSVSRSYADAWLTEIPLMYQSFFQQKNLSEDLIELKNVSMGVVYIHCASIAFKRGRILLLFGFINKALKEDSKIFLRDSIYIDLQRLIKKQLTLI